MARDIHALYAAYIQKNPELKEPLPKWVRDYVPPAQPFDIPYRLTYNQNSGIVLKALRDFDWNTFEVKSGDLFWMLEDLIYFGTIPTKLKDMDKFNTNTTRIKPTTKEDYYSMLKEILDKKCPELSAEERVLARIKSSIKITRG